MQVFERVYQHDIEKVLTVEVRGKSILCVWGGVVGVRVRAECGCVEREGGSRWIEQQQRQHKISNGGRDNSSSSQCEEL